MTIFCIKTHCTISRMGRLVTPFTSVVIWALVRSSKVRFFSVNKVLFDILLLWKNGFNFGVIEPCNVRSWSAVLFSDPEVSKFRLCNSYFYFTCNNHDEIFNIVFLGKTNYTLCVDYCFCPFVSDNQYKEFEYMIGSWIDIHNYRLYK